MRRKCFQNGKNTLAICKTQLEQHPNVTYDTTDFGKRKSSHRQNWQQPYEDRKIRPKILKTLKGEGVYWLTRMFQMAWKLGKTLEDCQTDVIIPE